MIRDRVDFSSEDPLKYPTLAVLWYILYRLCLLMAPINPMLYRAYLPEYVPFRI